MKQVESKTSKYKLIVLLLLVLAMGVFYAWKSEQSGVDKYTNSTQKAAIWMYNLSLPKQLSENLWLNEVALTEDTLKYVHTYIGDITPEKAQQIKSIQIMSMIDNIDEDLQYFLRKNYTILFEYYDPAGNLIYDISLFGDEIE